MRERVMGALVLWLMLLGLGACDGSLPRAAGQDGLDWGRKAAMDGAFALDLLQENHPATLAEVGDAAFVEALAQSRSRLAQRSGLVRDRAGYEAVMRGLFQGLGDPHLRWSPHEPIQKILWPGFILSRSGGGWKIAGEGPLAGARLLECDGREAEDWAKARIDAFAGDASLEAHLKTYAAWLMLDEGNPFLPRAGVCRFETADGRLRVLELEWQPIERETWRGMVDQAEPHGDAGLGLKRVGEGYWIGLNSLEGVGALVDVVEARSQELSQAPFVVVDLRGNRGGSTLFANRIFAAVVGDARTEEARKPMACSTVAYRTSEGNIDFMERNWGQGAGLKPRFMRMVGRGLTATYRACPVEGRMPVVPQGENEPRLVLVIDRSCLSSCILAVETGRRLGALLVGEATALNPPYLEVRSVEVPSGLGKVHTMMGVVSGVGPLGPHQPDHAYRGSMADDAGLTTWVLGEVLGTP